MGKHDDGQGGNHQPPNPYSSQEQMGDGQVPDGVRSEGDGQHKKPTDDDDD